MELIYIGDNFYQESRTQMSSLYTVEGRRSDWGFVNVALRNGETVHIRQSTKEEKKYYHNKLKQIKEGDQIGRT